MNDSNPSSRRRLFQWALAYVAFAVAANEALGLVGTAGGGLSSIAEQRVAVLLVAGFAPAMIFAWFHGARGAQPITRREISFLGPVVALTLAAPLVLVRPTELEVDEQPAQTSRVTPRWLAEDRIPIAVIPFAAEPADTSATRLARTLDSDVRSHLSLIGALRVSAEAAVAGLSSSGFAVSDATDALGDLQFVLTGTIEPGPEPSMLRAALTHVPDLTLVWERALPLDGTPGSTESLRSLLVHEVIDGLGLDLAPGEAERVFRVTSAPPAARQALEQARSLPRFTSREASRVAESLLRSAVEIDSTYASAWAELGAVVTGSTRFPGVPRERMVEGLELARRAVALDPTDPYNLGTEAFALRLLGRMDESTEVLLAILELEPSAADAFQTLSYFAFYRGRFVESMRYADAALDLHPTSGAALNSLANNWYVLGDYERALYWYDRATREQSPLGQKIRRINAIARSGAVEPAMTELEELSDSEPEILGDEHPLHHAAWLEMQRGDLDRAFDYLQRADARLPGGGSPILRGLLLQRLGRTEEADEALAQAEERARATLEQGDDRPFPVHELAQIEAIRGNVDEAIQLLEEAYRLGLRDSWAQPFELLAEDPRFIEIRDRMQVRREAELAAALEDGVGEIRP